MRPHGTTGSTAPAWVRERIDEARRAWPLWALGAALALAALASAALLGAMWSAAPVVYYALP